MTTDGSLLIRYIVINRVEALGLHVALVAGRLFGAVACDRNGGDPYSIETLQQMLSRSPAL